jgi:predicted LPLAT superfamily acyltransferase
MASVLECPVYTLFVLRRGARNHVYFELFAERVTWQRSSRDAVIADCAQKYAQRLEHYLRLEPLQWFNFYRFWRN